MGWQALFKKVAQKAIEKRMSNPSQTREPTMQSAGQLSAQNTAAQQGQPTMSMSIGPTAQHSMGARQAFGAAKNMMKKAQGQSIANNDVSGGEQMQSAGDQAAATTAAAGGENSGDGWGAVFNSAADKYYNPYFGGNGQGVLTKQYWQDTLNGIKNVFGGR